MVFDDRTVVDGMSGEESTQMIGAPVFEATQYTASVECPVCHTPNAPSETYCMDCGFMLSSTPAVVADMPAESASAKLVGADGILTFSLVSGENSIGREGADVLLTSNTVSRKHARIVLEESGASVEDLGCTNGTFVDGVKVQPGARIELKDGSELTFGSVVMIFHAPEVTAAGADPDDVAESDDEIAAAPVESLPEECVGDVAEDSIPEEAEGPVGQLVSKDGADALLLLEGLNTIGRREGVNTLVVSDPYCSGRHAEILVQGGMFTLTDLGSTNGTFVNGVKLEPNVPRQLHSGDEIKLGAPVFRLEVSDD